MDGELRVDERLSIPLAEVELSASTALDESQRARLAERAGAVVTAVAQESRGQARVEED